MGHESLAAHVRGIAAMTPASRIGTLRERVERALGAAAWDCSDAVWAADEAGLRHVDSPSWRAFTGQTPDQARGLGWLLAVHPDDRDAARQAWSGGAERTSPVRIQLRVWSARHLAFRQTLLLAACPTPRRDEADGPQEWVCALFDLADPGSHIPGEAGGDDERASPRQVFRAMAGRLGGALTSQEVVDLAVAQAPHLLGAVGALVVLSPGTNAPRVAAHTRMPPGLGARWHVVPDDAQFPAAISARTGMVLSTVHEDEGLTAETRPLVVGTRRLGAITLTWRLDREPDARLVAAAVSAICQALGRADTFERELGNAVDLQRSMLPTTLPRMDGAEVAVRYLRGSDEADAGDWFEATPLDDGRILLVVGTVGGPGLPAARTRTEFRHAVRALSIITSSPSALLGHLAAFHSRRSGSRGRLVTALLAVFDPRDGTLVWSSAGHVPPTRLDRSAGVASVLEGPQNIPLGQGQEWPEQAVSLGPGDLLVLTSNGLFPDRARPLEEELAMLADELPQLAASSASAVCDDLVERVVLPRVLADDVTVLCLRVDPAIRRWGWLLAAEASSVSEARKLVAEELERLGVDDEDCVQVTLLLTSELVTNAVVHTHGPVTVTVDRVDRIVRVSVVDDDPDLALAPQSIDVEAERGRGLLLVDVLAHSWGVTPQGPGKQVWFEVRIGG